MEIKNISKGYIRMKCKDKTFICSLPSEVLKIERVIAMRRGILTAMCCITGFSAPIIKYIDLSKVMRICGDTCPGCAAG